jgi:hypothetical protein
MSVFDMDGIELALDGIVPALVAKEGIENEINDAQEAQHMRSPVMRASIRNCICNLELGEEDNLAEVARANVLTEVTNNNPDNTPTDNQEGVTNTAL